MEKSVSSNMKDIAAGSFFVLVGAYFGINAWTNLTIGTTFRMGPGYFPIVLGILLSVLGAAILIKSLFAASGPIEGISVRGTVLISLAPIIFGATVQGLGLVGAILLSTLVAALSSRRVSPLFAIALTIGLTAFCILVFHYGLGLPMRLVGPWISGWGR